VGFADRLFGGDKDRERRHSLPRPSVLRPSRSNRRDLRYL